MNRRGYVYVLREVNGDHFKIGRTANPQKRLELFEVKLPFRIEFELVISGYNSLRMK